jgi:hypothetical protein
MINKNYKYEIKTIIAQIKKSGEGIITSIILQALGLFFSALILDGGFLLTIFEINICAWWIAFLVIFLRRAGNLSKFDGFYIKYGILMNLFVLSPVAVLLGSFLANVLRINT